MEKRMELVKKEERSDKTGWDDGALNLRHVPFPLFPLF
jgi:hypothetical protein